LRTVFVACSEAFTGRTVVTIAGKGRTVALAVAAGVVTLARRTCVFTVAPERRSIILAFSSNVLTFAPGRLIAVTAGGRRFFAIPRRAAPRGTLSASGQGRVAFLRTADQVRLAGHWGTKRPFPFALLMLPFAYRLPDAAAGTLLFVAFGR
jgi:hypothetical protein